jgi:Reverse transcriptase (RNA-dependent DNA polymerase)
MGLDYEETYAPMAKLASVRVVLAQAAADDLDLHQMDVDTAFLYAKLEGEELYMELPSGQLVRLRKAIYGLKQSPRLWYRTADDALAQIGFRRTTADACVYAAEWHGRRVVLVLYVDDLLIAAPPDARVDELKDELRKRFRMKDLGECQAFIGLQVERDRASRTLRLHQTGYTRQLLRAHGLVLAGEAGTTSKTHRTPVESKAHPLRQATEQKAELARREAEAGRPYAQLVGALMWLAMSTRPDIAQVTSELSRHLAAPTDEAHAAAKRVLRYLARAPDLGLQYGAPVVPHEMVDSALIGFADADYGGCVDHRRSRTAYIFLLEHGAVSWKSRLQPTVAMSTVEAEYMSSASAAREAIWLRRLVGELGYDARRPTVLLGDNTGAIALTHNAILSERSKHIDVMHHFVRERVEDGQLTTEYVRTTEMAADFLTKPIQRVAFERCCGTVGLIGPAPRRPSRASVGGRGGGG